MAAFSVYRNQNPRTKTAVPFLLDVQTDLFSVLGTRVVVPLYRPHAAGVMAMSRLTPVLRFQGHPLVAMVPELAGIPQRELGTLAGNLAEVRGEILQAIDLLLTGF